MRSGKHILEPLTPSSTDETPAMPPAAERRAASGMLDDALSACAALASRLAVLAESLTDPAGAITDVPPDVIPEDGRRDATSSTALLWSGSFARLENSLRRLSSAIDDYRELLRIEAQANA